MDINFQITSWLTWSSIICFFHEAIEKRRFGNNAHHRGFLLLWMLQHRAAKLIKMTKKEIITISLDTYKISFTHTVQYVYNQFKHYKIRFTYTCIVQAMNTKHRAFEPTQKWWEIENCRLICHFQSQECTVQDVSSTVQLVNCCLRWVPDSEVQY